MCYSQRNELLGNGANCRVIEAPSDCEDFAQSFTHRLHAFITWMFTEHLLCIRHEVMDTQITPGEGDKQMQ